MTEDVPVEDLPPSPQDKEELLVVTKHDGPWATIALETFTDIKAALIMNVRQWRLGRINKTKFWGTQHALQAIQKAREAEVMDEMRQKGSVPVPFRGVLLVGPGADVSKLDGGDDGED